LQKQLDELEKTISDLVSMIDPLKFSLKVPVEDVLDKIYLANDRLSKLKAAYIGKSQSTFSEPYELEEDLALAKIRALLIGDDDFARHNISRAVHDKFRRFVLANKSIMTKIDLVKKVREMSDVECTRVLGLKFCKDFVEFFLDDQIV